MTKELDVYDVVDAELVDEFGACMHDGFSCCPGGPAPLGVDPYDADVNNGHAVVYLHPACAAERAADI
jgi:hypothetical protein